MRSIDIAYVVRPHPTKNKPLVTPCKDLRHVNRLLQASKEAKVTFAKINVSSGEDAYHA